MNKELLKKFTPHLIILGLFILISVAFCAPVLKGKKLKTNDDLSSKALIREAEDFNKKTGEFVPWTTRMFSGFPISYGSGGGITNVSYRPIYTLSEMFDGFSFDVILWCLIGMYIMLIIMGLNHWLAALGSFIFAFSAFNILSIEAGHVQKTFNFAFVPILLGGIYLVLQRKHYVWGFILTAIGVNYQIVIGHYQVTYYAALASGILAAFFGIKYLIQKEAPHVLKSAGILVVAVILGTLPNIGLLNTYYASHETTRGGKSELTITDPNQNNKDGGLDIDYATQWSYSPGESFTFIIPDVYGGEGIRAMNENKNSEVRKLAQNPQYGQLFDAAQRAGAVTSYWGKQPFVGGPMYFGAIVCFLFVLGLIVYNGVEKWWLLAIGVLFLLLSWGQDSFLYVLFFEYAPVFSKFRTPSMALGIVQITFAVIAVLGLKALLENPIDAKMKKQFFIAAGTVGGLLLIFWLAPGIFFSFSGNESIILEKNKFPAEFSSALQSALISDRTDLMKTDTLRSLALVLVAAALVFLYINKTIKGNILLIAISVMIVGDLWSFNKRYMNEKSFVSKQEFKKDLNPSGAFASILENDKSLHYRVFNMDINPTQDYQTSMHVRSIGGYHGAKLRKYQELIERHINRANPSVMRMLDTRYIIREGQPMKYPFPCGPAWFVKEIQWVDSADQEMNALNYVDSTATGFDPLKTAVIQKKNAKEIETFKPVYDSTATITLTEYDPIHAKYTTAAKTDQMAVFSEIYYMQEDGDGWRAYIDGKEVPNHRVNYVLRGMKVPAGNHTIEFRFDYSQSKMRNNLGFGFLMVLVAILGFTIYREVKKHKVVKA